MSERESLSGDSVQRWKGVNQRTSPTLVQDGFFTHSLGVYFANEGVVRLHGKRLVGKLAAPIFQIYQVGNIALLQTKDALWSITVDELNNFHVTLIPEQPDPPTLYNLLNFSMTVEAPPAYPAHTLSFRVQMRYVPVQRSGGFPDVPDAWTDMTVGDTLPGEIFNLTGLWEGGIYDFRSVATNSYGVNYSTVARVQLPWADPSFNAPVYSDIHPLDFQIVVPAIPSVTVFSILWLTGADPDDIGDYTDVGGNCSPTAVVNNDGSDLITVVPDTDYTFRYAYTLKKANGTFIDIITMWSTVRTIPVPPTLRITSTGDRRVTNTGDTRKTS